MDDIIFWVVQTRSHVFATWKPVALLRTREHADMTREEFEKVKGKNNVKVDRVVLMD